MSLFKIKSNDHFLGALSDFISLFFPEYCLGCSQGMVKGEDILCSRCLLNLPRTGYTQMNHNPVWEKFLGRLPLKDAWAFLRFRKEGIVQHLLHQLKYANHPEIGIRLGMLFGKELKDNGITDFDLIIPLPLHPAKQRKRGYNQSTKLAEGISALLEVPYDDRICKRVLNTVTQTQKTKSQRWENVNQAFSVSNPSAIEGKKLLLVDDVITTGATLEACGQTLFSCGAKELSIACIAEAQ